MPPVMSQHQDPNFATNNPKEKMITKYTKFRATKVILEEPKAGRTSRDSVLRGLHLRKEPIAELCAPLPVEIFQRESEVSLNSAVKLKIHRPSPRRSCSHVIDALGSWSIS